MHPVEPRSDFTIVEVLEDCRVRLARGESVAQCLSAYPRYQDELVALLPLVGELEELTHDPNPNYVAGARRRFRAILTATQESRAREAVVRNRGRSGWLRRLAAPLILVVFLSLSGLGLVQAAEPSLPDSPLYSVKQVSENVDQVFARTSQQRAQVQLKVANRRWLDLERAISQKKGPQVMLTIATAMVDASELATDHALQSDGPGRISLTTQLRTLLPKERIALNILVSSQRIAISQAGRGLQQELVVDEQKLAQK